MKQNFRKKALVPAIAMVVASVIALSGVTYAWFTTGNTASVTGLDVNVQTANGIQISLDANKWKSVITADDLVEAIGSATAYADRCIQLPGGEIAPVSSAGIAADGKLQMFYGEYDKSGNLRSVSEVEENRTSGGNFVAFDLFFKSTMKQNLTLNLGDSASFVKGTASMGGFDNVGTEKAVRVAFLDMGSAATDAAARKLNDVKNVYIWEPNASTRADGVSADTGKLTYKGFKTEFESIPENELTDAQVATVETFVTDKVITELQSGISKIRVYIWLEGQDVDCINNISFGDFTANLAFSVPEIED